MQSEQQKEKKLNEDTLKDLWDNIKCSNIYIIGGPNQKKKKKEREIAGIKNLFEETMTENSPNLSKN